MKNVLYSVTVVFIKHLLIENEYFFRKHGLNAFQKGYHCIKETLLF